MELLTQIGSIASIVMTIAGAIIFLCKPIRDKLFGLHKVQEGTKCLLRTQMLAIYYANKNEKKIRDYERKNFDQLYEAYKSLHGNSFADDINKAVRSWEIEKEV